MEETEELPSPWWPTKSKASPYNSNWREMVMEETEEYNFVEVVGLIMEDKQKLLSNLEHMISRM